MPIKTEFSMSSKCFFIDIDKKQVTEIDLPNDSNEIQEVLGFVELDSALLTHNLVMYYDNEAFRKPRPIREKGFVFELEFLVISNAIILGFDDNGKFITPNITLEDFNELISFEDIEIL